MTEALRCPRHRGISNVFGKDQRYCSLCGKKLVPNIPPPERKCTCGYTMGLLDSFCASCGKPVNTAFSWLLFLIGGKWFHWAR